MVGKTQDRAGRTTGGETRKLRKQIKNRGEKIWDLGPRRPYVLLYIYIIYTLYIWSPELFSANGPSREADRTVSKPPGLNVMKSPDDMTSLASVCGCVGVRGIMELLTLLVCYALHRPIIDVVVCFLRSVRWRKG